MRSTDCWDPHGFGVPVRIRAIIPARLNSSGIPDKNRRPLAGGLSPLERTILICEVMGIPFDVVTDEPLTSIEMVTTWLRDAHDEQICLYLQPTQPLRHQDHLSRALGLLAPSIDSVISVVKLPLAYGLERRCTIGPSGWLRAPYGPLETPPPRQGATPVYVRDGTVYAFWARTVRQHGNFYGKTVIPMIMDPKETLPLDTLEDWAKAEEAFATPSQT